MANSTFRVRYCAPDLRCGRSGISPFAYDLFEEWHDDAGKLLGQRLVMSYRTEREAAAALKAAIHAHRAN